MKTRLWSIMAVAWGLLAVAGAVLYPGSILVYALFTLSFLALIISAYVFWGGYGYAFLAVFFWLGFWLKLVAHLLLKYDYIEPVGAFDGSAVSMDAVLVVSAVAALGAILARLVVMSAERSRLVLRTETSVLAPVWYASARGKIWAGWALFVLCLAAFNVFYGIHQIGLLPRHVFFWPVNALVAWGLNIGAAMAAVTFLNWDIRLRKNEFLPVLLAISESSVSTISVLSRGTYIYHAVPAFVCAIRENVFSGPHRGCKTILVTGFLIVSFFASLYAVGALRGRYYGDLPADSREGPRLGVFFGQVARLSVDRWIGLEGVMAVHSYPYKGESLFFSALSEKRVPSENLLFDEVSGSNYRFSDKTRYQFASIPGAAGFFYYYGSPWAVLVGIFLLVLAAILIEGFVWVATANRFMCSLIGMLLGNTIAQFGTAPRQMLSYFAMTFAAILFVMALERTLPSTKAAHPASKA